MQILSAANAHLSSWHSDRPFPLSDEACVALCRGDLVHIGDNAEEMLAELPFRFEMIDGWIMLKR